MSTIDLTDAEAAVTASIRRAIEEDRFPAPRASTRCARKLDPKAPPPVTNRK
jgi:hypothetical protein